MNLDSSERQTLIRGLGLIAAVSIIIGNVIGTGVFLKARVMTCNVGSPTWVILAWVAAGFLSLAGALTYAELTAMKPEAAGPYAFLRESYGRLSNFLFGLMQLFFARTGSQAGVAVVFAIALNDYLDGGLKQTLLSTNILGMPFEITTLQIIAVVVIAIFTTLNCLSVTMSGQIATSLTMIKIGLVVLVGLGAFMFVTGGNFGNFSLMNTGGTCEGVADAVRIGSAEYTIMAGVGAGIRRRPWG